MSIIFAGLKDSSKDNSESDSENFQRTTTFPEAVIENKNHLQNQKRIIFHHYQKMMIFLTMNCILLNHRVVIITQLFYYFATIYNFFYTIFIYSPSIKNPKTH